MKDLEYPSRLKHLKLHSLGYRRKRADILQVFKYCKGFDLQNGDQIGTENVIEAETLTAFKMGVRNSESMNFLNMIHQGANNV